MISLFRVLFLHAKMLSLKQGLINVPPLQVVHNAEILFRGSFCPNFQKNYFFLLLHKLTITFIEIRDSLVIAIEGDHMFNPISVDNANISRTTVIIGWPELKRATHPASQATPHNLFLLAIHLYKIIKDFM